MAEGSSQLPAQPPDTPGFPSNPLPLIFEGFSGLNTKPVRNDIKDDECYILDGFMPLGASNIRTIPDVGSALFTASGSLTIISFYFANIGSTPICLVLQSDGSVVQVNTSTAVVTTVMPAGTITSPTKGFSISQASGNQFVLIVAPQTNGYWVWNGSVLATAGTLSLSVTMTNVGSGYTSAPAVSVSGGSGGGAAFAASVSNGNVLSVAVTNPGSGWTAGQTVTLGFSGGGGSSAAATMTLMPFGIQGTVIETYVSRAWVANGPNISYTAPGSVTDFATSDGAGTIQSQDSFLRVGFYGLKQANGFLYLLGDSSINTISGVTTSGSPPTTTFSNQNVDPQIGTPWKDTVQVFSRNIVFANSFGIHVSYGGAVTRISAPLDGIYTSVPSIGSFLPSSAVASIFGIQSYMLLYPIVDQYTGQKVNKLLMWDGKRWWTTQQSVTLNFISSQEINSVLTAWGTNGTSIYPLFQTGSTNFTKVAQSRLWATPGYFFTKVSREVFGLFYFTALNGVTTIYVDKEFGTSSPLPVSSVNLIIWENASGGVVTWANSLGQPVSFASSGYGVFRAQVGQWGQLLGLTVVTTDSDATVSSLTLFAEIFQSNL
jgi:hypothetical protein